MEEESRKLILRVAIQINTVPSTVSILLSRIPLQLALIIPLVSLPGEARWLLEIHATQFKDQITPNVGLASHANCNHFLISLYVWAFLEMPLVSMTNHAIRASSVNQQR